MAYVEIPKKNSQMYFCYISVIYNSVLGRLTRPRSNGCQSSTIIFAKSISGRQLVLGKLMNQ